MAVEKFYIIKTRVVNREQRRASKKEAAHIDKVLTPIFIAFKKTFPNPTQKNIDEGYDFYKSECAKVNKNKKYVEANPNAFIIAFKAQEEIKMQDRSNNKIKVIAYSIISIILMIIILSILS